MSKSSTLEFSLAMNVKARNEASICVVHADLLKGATISKQARAWIDSVGSTSGGPWKVIVITHLSL